MLGQWKNYEELEEYLTLDELYATVKQLNEERHINQRFAAALKGVDIDEGKEDGVKSFEDIQKRAQAILNGEDPDNAEKTELEELSDLGLVQASEDNW